MSFYRRNKKEDGTNSVGHLPFFLKLLRHARAYSLLHPYFSNSVLELSQLEDLCSLLSFYHDDVDTAGEVCHVKYRFFGIDFLYPQRSTHYVHHADVLDVHF